VDPCAHVRVLCVGVRVYNNALITISDHLQELHLINCIEVKAVYSFSELYTLWLVIMGTL